MDYFLHLIVAYFFFPGYVLTSSSLFQITNATLSLLHTLAGMKTKEQYSIQGKDIKCTKYAKGTV